MTSCMKWAKAKYNLCVKKRIYFHFLADTCTKKNTVYTEKCDRKCGDNECATKTFGCYCITGYVLDENDNCIKESDCTCKVDSKVYQVISYLFYMQIC